MLDARLPVLLKSSESEWEDRFADATANECRFFAVAGMGMTTDGRAALEKRGEDVAVSQFSEGSREVDGTAATVEDEERVDAKLDAGEAGREGGGGSSKTSSSFNGFNDDRRRRLEGGDDELDEGSCP